MSDEDVAKFCVIALEDTRARNQVISVGGPENLTFNQVAELYEQVGGRPAKKSHVPLPIMRVMRLVMRAFNPTLSLQITGGILMDTENQAYDMSATLKQYPVKLVRLEEIARQMVKSTRE